MPAYRIAGDCVTITSHDSPVPSPPTIANSGHSTPRKRRFGFARNATSSWPRCLTRMATSDACAIVNENVAPKA